jgi:23S rRNA (adenine2503-C2)-methyltransferase
VVLPYEDRTSVCISSQAGCPVGCVFCATATMGFARNLTAGEMVDQVLTARENAPEPDAAPGETARARLSHVVVMGMGEPLLNYDNLVRAFRLLHEEVGLSYRHLTVSTAGYVPGILRLAEEGLPVTLALSLHAPNDPLRAELIPMSRKWGVREVMDAVREYTENTGRRVTLEYLLLAGVNDEELHARELGELARGTINHVNLIPWNPADSFTRFEAPSRERVRRFRAVLEQYGVTVTQRVERGQDIAAACGQLAVLQGKGKG